MRGTGKIGRGGVPKGRIAPSPQGTEKGRARAKRELAEQESESVTAFLAEVDANATRWRLCGKVKP